MIFSGGPGSGKGTQCARIVEEFRFKHISAGDLLRQEVAKETEQGKVIQEIMTQGKLVPPEITVTLLRQAILSNKEAVGFLIDGFPRELSQSKIFEEQVLEISFKLVFLSHLSCIHVYIPRTTDLKKNVSSYNREPGCSLLCISSGRLKAEMFCIA